MTLIQFLSNNSVGVTFPTLLWPQIMPLLICLLNTGHQVLIKIYIFPYFSLHSLWWFAM